MKDMDLPNLVAAVVTTVTVAGVGLGVIGHAVGRCYLCGLGKQWSLKITSAESSMRKK